MTEIPADIEKQAEDFTPCFYNGEPGHAREQFKNSFAAAIMAERDRCMNEFERAAESGIDAAVQAERKRCATFVRKWNGYAEYDRIAAAIERGDEP